MLQKVKKAFYTLIAPTFCASCSKYVHEVTVLCALCTSKIQPIAAAHITLSSTITMPVFAIGAYDGPLQKLILAKGWSNVIASYQLGNLLWQRSYVPQCAVDYIVPVPLHWSRSMWRGYNQAYEMATSVSGYMHVPIYEFVQRVKRTAPQVSLMASARLENVSDAFCVSEKYYDMIHNKHIMIIDDVMTTGATLKAVGKALLSAKPASIVAVVAARVVG